MKTTPLRRRTTAATSALAGTASVESVRQSLVALRRLFQRKELAELWAATYGDRSRLDYGDLRLLDAVRVAQTTAASGGATVGAVSRLLGVDASRASRQVASGVAKGLLSRVADQGDGRKVVLRITAAGERLLAKGSQVSRSRIALALDTWNEADRRKLAGLLDRFVDQLMLDQPAYGPASDRGR